MSDEAKKKIALKIVSGAQQTGADHKNWQLIAYRLMSGVRSLAKNEVIRMCERKSTNTFNT